MILSRLLWPYIWVSKVEGRKRIIDFIFSFYIYLTTDAISRPRRNAALAAEEALKIAEMEESFVRCNKAQVNLVSAMPDGTPIQVLEKNIHLVHAHCQALILFFSNT